MPVKGWTVGPNMYGFGSLDDYGFLTMDIVHVRCRVCAARVCQNGGLVGLGSVSEAGGEVGLVKWGLWGEAIT